MPVMISMLRGVNVGGHNQIKMDALRALYVSLKLKDPQTYVQSGNVVFRTDERAVLGAAKRIEDGIERSFGFRSPVIVRTLPEMRDVVERNPFGKRRDVEPSRLLVTFLASEPAAAARDKVLRLQTDPEEVRVDGREMYIYYPNGMARPKIAWTAIEKILGVFGTGRNWNSVTKLLEMAEKLAGSD
jgi:uncharacterized protein (DUF1697 family)